MKARWVLIPYFTGHSPPNMGTNGMPNQIPRTSDPMLLVLNQPQQPGMPPSMQPGMIRPPQHSGPPPQHGQRYPNVATSPVLSTTTPPATLTRLPTKSQSMEGELFFV